MPMQPYAARRAAIRRGYAALIAALDTRVFPAIVRFATHPLVILGTVLLIIPLIAFASITVFVLLGNTYLNICSAAVSSIVLMQSLRHHRETTASHAALHAKVDALGVQSPVPTPPTALTAATARSTAIPARQRPTRRKRK